MYRRVPRLSGLEFFALFYYINISNSSSVRNRTSQQTKFAHYMASGVVEYQSKTRAGIFRLRMYDETDTLCSNVLEQQYGVFDISKLYMSVH